MKTIYADEVTSAIVLISYLVFVCAVAWLLRERQLKYW
jgi:hypothetical protein